LAVGLAPGFDFINDQGERFGVYLHLADRSFLELFQGEADKPAAGQSYRHFCLEMDDLEAEVARLRAAGVQVTDPHLGSDHGKPGTVTYFPVTTREHSAAATGRGNR
jgi:catechol 2,3-dioxygenase-like lactoylglutathione lyase family enzyme